MDKDNAKSSNKHRQECTPDFKREAVNLVETSSKSVPQIAKDLGISDSILYKWQKQLGKQGEQAFLGKGHQTPAEEELHRLQLEVEHPKQEREILLLARIIVVSVRSWWRGSRIGRWPGPRYVDRPPLARADLRLNRIKKHLE